MIIYIILLLIIIFSLFNNSYKEGLSLDGLSYDQRIEEIKTATDEELEQAIINSNDSNIKTLITDNGTLMEHLDKKAALEYRMPQPVCIQPYLYDSNVNACVKKEKEKEKENIPKCDNGFIYDEKIFGCRKKCNIGEKYDYNENACICAKEGQVSIDGVCKCPPGQYITNANGDCTITINDYNDNITEWVKNNTEFRFYNKNKKAITAQCTPVDFSTNNYIKDISDVEMLSCPTGGVGGFAEYVKNEKGELVKQNKVYGCKQVYLYPNRIGPSNSTNMEMVGKCCPYLGPNGEPIGDQNQGLIFWSNKNLISDNIPEKCKKHNKIIEIENEKKTTKMIDYIKNSYDDLIKMFT